MVRRRLSVLLLLVLVGAWTARPVPALARAAVIRSEPADGALLAAAPRQVQLWFSQPVAVAGGAVSLLGADGRAYVPTRVSTTFYRPAEVGLDDQFDATYLYLCSLGTRTLPSLLTVELPALAEGTFTLRWQAVGLEERHTATGALVFAIGPQGTGAPVPEAQASAQLADDLLVSLSVRPNLPGANFLDLSVVSTRRPAPASVEQVIVALRGPNGAAGGQQLAAQPLGGGRYQVASDALSRPGDWQVLVTVRRPGLSDARATLPWSVPTGQPSLDWRLVLGLILALMALVLGRSYSHRSEAGAKV